MMLHWNHDEVSNISHSFDLIVASDWLVVLLFIFFSASVLHFSLQKEKRETDNFISVISLKKKKRKQRFGIL